MSPTERRQAANFTIDLQTAESKIDEICRLADEKLQSLLEIEETSFDAPNKPSANDALVHFEIRLGSTRMLLSELQNATIDDIAPLIEAQKGRVQIWSDGKMRAAGTLLVVDGKLAVRVEEIVRQADED